MKCFFPKSQIPLNQECLLLCCFQRILKEDIENSQSSNDVEWKTIWFEKWENQVEAYLTSKKNTIAKLEVLKEPNEKFMNVLDNLDIQLLYNNIQKDISNCGKTWEIELYRQCYDFTPYNWDDLLQKERRIEKKWHEKLYIKIQTLHPRLTLNQISKKNTLKEIAQILHIKPLN